MYHPIKKLMPYLNLETVTTVMAILGHIALYVQTAKIVYLESSYAVSLTGVLIGYVSMIFWLAYGLSREIRPLIISNFFGIIGATILILAILYYHEEQTPLKNHPLWASSLYIQRTWYV